MITFLLMVFAVCTPVNRTLLVKKVKAKYKQLCKYAELWSKKKLVHRIDRHNTVFFYFRTTGFFQKQYYIKKRLQGRWRT